MTQPTDPEELKTDEPSQDEVEAVAQAIHKCDEPGELADAPSAHRRFCYDAARAAIAAMPRREGGVT